MQQWMLYTKRADFNEISARFLILPYTARIMVNRDIKEDEMEMFLRPDIGALHSPYLLEGIEEAALFLKNKILSNKSILIVGDYDIDGVCSTYIYYSALKKLGACVDYVIPDRIKDGYGINKSIINEAADRGIDTVLTCDNGISAFEALSYGKSLGLNIIVTDHHEVFKDENGQDRLPEADIVIDPKKSTCTYPYKEICGAMVAYKLVKALYLLYGIEESEVFTEFEDFVSIATVGDVMPLRDENRIILKQSLKRLKNTKNIGLLKLIEVCSLNSKQITSFDIGFIIGPCINAGGRLESAETALRLFISDKEDEAVNLALHLKELNDERKALTLKNFNIAVEQVEKLYLNDKILVVYLKDCHESLAGIIAGRLRERYYKPVFVLTDTQEGTLKGSGRSIENYDMFKGLCSADIYLLKYGGHKMAAGLSLEREKLEQFRKYLNENCTLSEDDLKEKIWIDIALPFSYITIDFLKELELLEPFGAGNAKPAFAGRDIEILSARVFGSERNVVKLKVKGSDGFVIDALVFTDGDKFIKECQEYKYMSAVFYPQINDYMGRKNIELIIRHYKFTGN